MQQIRVWDRQGRRNCSIRIKADHPIAWLRQQIYQQLRFPSLNFRMIFGDKQLDQEELPLKDYGITENSQVQVIFRLVGGIALATTVFNNLKHPICQSFDKNAPKWRSIGCGLTLEGTCKNKDCEAYDDYVLAYKGFGKFNMSKETRCTKCPLCNFKLLNVQNLHLFQAKMVVVGLVSGEPSETRMEYKHEDPKNSLSFVDKDELRTRWEYLEIKVSKL